ncbi:MAG: methyl-accepting chemotaxis protein, partial [Desulfobacteraceae bacterium]
MKFDFNKRGILAKLLFPISGIFILSMLILVFVIIQMQGRFTTNMGRSVSDVLQSTTESVQSQLAKMETEVAQSLKQNLAQASNTLSENTSSELSKVEADIITDLELNLRRNAESIASLMAQVAPRAILSNNFADLVSYVKSVTSRPDVIYAIYLKPDGRPITRYFNRKDPKIKAYIKNGTGKKKLDKVLSTSSKDSSVLIVEKALVLEGKPLGKIVLCMDKSSILAKQDEVKKRFNALTNNNTEMINASLEQVSSVTGAKMKTTLKSIAEQSNKAWTQIGRDINHIGSKARSRMQGALTGIGLVFGLIMLSVIGALTLLIIIRPVNAAVAGLKDIAQGEGDLTMRLSISSKDEVGELAKWFNVFIEKLQGLIKDISGGVETLSSSSTELSAISGQMSQGIQNVSDKSNTVSTAAEEMSGNMNTVSAAMEQSATNANMVASAAEEMSSTIGEIAQNAEKARIISDEANNKVNNASTNMDQLGRAADSIGKVVETITDISEQVNLLALNATIEAARAGEAGKGFAVVANEIKELAKQTAEATQDIKEKIEGIQGTTSTTVGQITEINQVIANVSSVVANIATAVEQQSAATKEIAGNVAQASQGIQEVNENVNQSSSVSSEISSEIAGVNVSMNEMATSSNQVNISAQELSQLS